MYNDLTDNGTEREIGHLEDARRAPSRGIYASIAIACKPVKSLVVVVIKDRTDFKRRLIDLFGADHPLASLSPH